MPIRMEDTHVALIEQGVPPHEQTMTLEKPFWAFFIVAGAWYWIVLKKQARSPGLAPAA